MWRGHGEQLWLGIVWQGWSPWRAPSRGDWWKCSPVSTRGTSSFEDVSAVEWHEQHQQWNRGSQSLEDKLCMLQKIELEKWPKLLQWRSPMDCEWIPDNWTLSDVCYWSLVYLVQIVIVPWFLPLKVFILILILTAYRRDFELLKRFCILKRDLTSNVFEFVKTVEILSGCIV